MTGATECRRLTRSASRIPTPITSATPRPVPVFVPDNNVEPALQVLNAARRCGGVAAREDSRVASVEENPCAVATSFWIPVTVLHAHQFRRDAPQLDRCSSHCL